MTRSVGGERRAEVIDLNLERVLVSGQPECNEPVHIWNSTEEKRIVVTEPLAEAIAAAEKLIAESPHVESEQDLVEGQDYLAGMIRAAIQSAWGFERDYPYFLRSATAQTKVGLDNPDTLYFSARVRDDAVYIVSGTRGSCVDMSFQVLNGDYLPTEAPGSLTAFDDRDIVFNPDGTFEARFGPAREEPGENYFVLAPGAAMLLVRQVYNDWATERPGELRIHRDDTLGTPQPAPTAGLIAKRYAAAAKILTNQIKTFEAFPKWFYLNLPVNTMTEPRLTPGGLATQYSSVGHFDLAENEAMIVSVPADVAPYQGFQLGSLWYVSLDYVTRQTSLTQAQAQVDPDGRIRYVISSGNPGVVNWLDTTGHRKGYLQYRWQRVSRELGTDDGPEVEIVDLAEVPKRLPYFEQSTVTGEQWAERIAARQLAVAARMLGG
jgi:hypothetical protein